MSRQWRSSYLFRASRGGYYVRVRGWRAAADGELVAVDTKEKIPDRLFLSADPPVRPDRRTKRGDQIAARYAAADEERRNAISSIPRHALRLHDIGSLWQRKLASVRKAETIARAAKWQRAIARTVLTSGDGSAYTLNDISPCDLDVGHLEDYRDARARVCAICTVPADAHSGDRHAFRGVSPRTVFNELAHVRDLLGFARTRERETGVTYTRLARLPEVANRAGVHPKLKPTVDQHFAIREAAATLAGGDRYVSILDFGFNTGLRKHSLAGFDLAWYDRERRAIHVPAEHMKGGRKLDVPISAWAASILDSIIERDGRETGLAWPNPETGVEQADFSRVERKLSALAKLPRKFSLHGVRGAFNSVLINHRCEKHRSEVPFHIREQLMGHALDSQVQAYSNFEDEVLREAVLVFDCVREAHLVGKKNVLAFKRA